MTRIRFTKNVVDKKSFLFLIAVLCLSIAHGQQIDQQQHTLSEVFKLLTQRHGVSFSYDNEIRPLQKVIVLDEKTTLNTYLNYLSSAYQLRFRRIGPKVIAVTKGADPITIKGQVIDATSGQPLLGATILTGRKGSTAKTDVNGHFSVKIANESLGEVFTASYIGYATARFVSTTDTTVIELHPQEESVEEVIITSTYDRPRLREETVGSINSLTAKELQTARPMESVDKMLEGMVPGVYVEPTTSLATPVKIHIRGPGTLSPVGNSRSTSSQPLFVVDGVPVQEQQRGDIDLSLFNQETILNPIAGINPMDIESISVLKDAAATTIYGANASNGVILITTKSGRPGRPKLQVLFDAGTSTFINQIKLLSGPAYHTLLKEYLMNTGVSESTAERRAGSKTIDTDWFGLTSRNANYQNLNASLSGGTDHSNYFLSAGYRNQENASPGNDLKQYTIALRYNNKLSDRLRLNTTFTPTLMKRNGLDSYANAAYMPPNMPPYQEDGSYTIFLNILNPIAYLNENFSTSQTLTGNARIELQYDIKEHLYVRTVAGGNLFQSKQEIFESGINGASNANGGRLRIYDRMTYSWTSLVQIGYTPKLGGNHQLSSLLGVEARDQYSNLLMGQGSGFSYERLIALGLARNTTSISSKISDATLSYYTQFNYDYDKRYYATLSGRADQSSMFGGDRQLAVNAALGLGWNISNEYFMADQQWIDFLRIRMSLGSTGNSRIGSYASRGLYDLRNTTYGGQTSAQPSSSAAENPDLGWETTIKINGGIDLNAFGRLRLGVDVYKNLGYDLISTVNVPLETGFSGIPINTGNMYNQGLDFSINYQWIKRQAFNWSTTLNSGWNKNKVLQFNSPLATLYGATSTNNIGNAQRPGYSTTAIWGVQWAGVDVDTGEEMFYTPTGERVDKITIRSLGIDAYQVLGNSLPVFQGGMINTIKWKNISATFNIQYNLGGSRFVPTTYLRDGSNLDHSNMSINMLDRWQQPGDITLVPKLNSSTPVNNSSRYLYNTSYIKLSNVSLSYQLNGDWTKRWHIPQSTINANITNVFYWFHDKSPTGRNGIREYRFTYPETQNFSIGIRMSI